MPAGRANGIIFGILDGLAETAQVSENGYKEPVGDAEAVVTTTSAVSSSPSQTARYTPLRGSCCRYRATPPFWGTQVLQGADIPLAELFEYLDLQALMRGSGSSAKGAVEGRI